ncbi:MAG: Ldh family oxidoreductase [Pseudomonadota bacterium]
MPDIAIAEIEALSMAALMRAGADRPVAQSVAKAVAEAEAHGNVICGLYYLESYCTQLGTGRVDGTAEPELSQPRPAAVFVDAKHGFAQPAFDAGFDAAIAAASACGTAVFSIGGSHTCTSLGYFTERLARAGVVTIGTTNASAIVAPPGGKDRVLGTNPIAFSVPDGAGGLAIHFDTATSAVALGKITMAKEAGETIPIGWATDADGRDTTDPSAAVGGALKSAAGYKGWGIGLMVEVLAAALTGSVLSTEVQGLKLPDGPPHRLGQTYILIDPTVFSDRFDGAVAQLLASVAAQEGARVPGGSRRPATHAAVPDALWSKVKLLSGTA